MAQDLLLTPAWIFAGLSLALVVAALVGPWSGAIIDRWGGRPVLVATNLLFALGLALLALCQGPFSLLAAWSVLGLAMGAGLYEGAFAAVVRLRGRESRRAITGITLIAGFASTVGWPLTAWMIGEAGWRGACIGWLAVHLLIALPLHLSLTAPASPPVPPDPVPLDGAEPARRRRIAILLAISFAVTWFTSTAMAAHLPRLLQEGGLSAGAALACAMLVGPSQVAARILEFSLLDRLHPLLPARLASAAHSVGGLAFLVCGGPLAAVFTILHGAGNGILTIAKGTLPLVLLGPAGYGARQGLLMAPARIGQAAAPLLTGLALDAWGVGALWLTIGLGVLGTWVLLLVKDDQRTASAMTS